MRSLFNGHRLAGPSVAGLALLAATLGACDPLPSPAVPFVPASAKDVALQPGDLPDSQLQICSVSSDLSSADADTWARVRDLGVDQSRVNVLAASAQACDAFKVGSNKAIAVYATGYVVKFKSKDSATNVYQKGLLSKIAAPTTSSGGAVVGTETGLGQNSWVANYLGIPLASWENGNWSVYLGCSGIPDAKCQGAAKQMNDRIH